MTFPGTKKIVIPIAVVAAGIAGLLLVSPSAIAQLSNSTSTNNGANTTSSGKPSVQITGTINLAKVITDQVKVSFSDAAKTAQDQITGGMVVGGRLGPMQGYLVYTFTVVNPSTNTAYMVVVDPGNGAVLYTSPGHPIGSFLGANHAYGMKMMHRHMGGQGWQGQQAAPQSAPQSQFTVPPAVLNNS